MKKIIVEKIDEHIDVMQHLDAKSIYDISDAIVNVFKHKNKVILFGNGGSAADAIHLSAEFSGKYLMDREPLPAITLCSNLSAITAVSNDYSYDIIFERQLKAIGRKGDCIIGISTSGNSVNVLRAIEYAKENDLCTIGFSGTKGRLKEIVDFPLVIPSDSTPRIQEGYMLAGHIICNLVERRIYG